MKLSKQEVTPFWKAMIGIHNETELETHFNEFFGVSIDALVDDINHENERKEAKMESVMGIGAKTNFFKKELDLFSEQIREIVEGIGFIEDKENFIDSHNEQLEKILENDLWYFLIDEATLYFKENPGAVKKNNGEEMLRIFVEEVFHTSQFRNQCEVLYAELFELIRLRIHNYLSYINEILNHIALDFDNLGTLIPNFNSPLKLADIKLGSGDTHTDGRSVAKLVFNQGVIYYKPRNGELDIHFFDFLDELYSYNSKFKFKRMQVINKGSYAYFEQIEHVLIKDQDEMRIYYEKLGYLLCIMYTLNGTDFHSENIIAHGAEPVLVDLESLFHSNIFLNENLYDNGFLEIVKSSDPSVLDIGILPKKIVKNYDSDDYSLEIGGIGAEKQKVSPFKFSEFSIDEKGTPKHIRKFGVNEVSENNPVKEISDSEIALINSFMQESFEYFYDWILKNKLLYINLVTKYFNNQKIRVILRPTFLYAKLLLLSKNVYLLGNKTNRKILFSKLAYERQNQMAFVYSEYEQLMKYEIPIFYAYTNQLEIYSARNEKLGILSDKTPLESSILKIKRMSADDLDNQKILIDQAMRLKEYKGDKTDIVFGQFEGTEKTIDEKQAIRLCQDIGDLLIKRAVDLNGNSATWISTTILGKEESEFSVGPVGNDIYLGNAGIALYLAHLYKFTNEEKYKDIVEKAVHYNIRFLQQEKLYENGNIGYYNGTSGLLLSVAIINRIIPIPNFDEIINMSLDRLRKLAKNCNNFDIFAGSSGLISSLIVLSNMYPEYLSHIRPLLQDSYENLRANAVRRDGVAYWKNKNTLAYVGYAHGNAGILAALIKLKSIENELFGYSLVDVNFLQGIWNFIDSAYDEQLNNWENTPGSKKYSYGWCHGAQGLLMTQTIAKECCSQFLRDEDYIKNLVDITVREGFGANPSYCHGDLGSLRTLEYYSKVFGDQDMLEKCRKTYATIYQRTISKKWRKQVLSHSESLGLLLGVSGWGYSVLQYLYPDEVFDFFTL